MLFSTRKNLSVPSAEAALPGRETPIPVPNAAHRSRHHAHAAVPRRHRGRLLRPRLLLGRRACLLVAPGVHTTAVGYQGGSTPNPTYEEVCSGRTGHTEAVLVAYDPTVISYDTLLKTFWEVHDPTQGMRQGNDVGTQYRSAIYTVGDEQAAAAEASRRRYDDALARAGKGQITTEIEPADGRPFYYAEDYHQQYLSPAKNPGGYCSMTGTGVSCPIGVGVSAA